MLFLDVKVTTNTNTMNDTYWVFCSELQKFVRVGKAKLEEIRCYAVGADSFITKHRGKFSEKFCTYRFQESEIWKVKKLLGF